MLLATWSSSSISLPTVDYFCGRQLCALVSHSETVQKSLNAFNFTQWAVLRTRKQVFHFIHWNSTCWIKLFHPFFCSIHSFFILVFLPSSSHHSHCKQARLIVSIHLPPERQNDRRERSQPRRDCRLIDSMLLSQVFFFWKYLLFSHRNLQFPCRRSAAKSNKCTSENWISTSLFFSLFFR